ncbi:MAG: biosynthetic arginine decarboxylase [Woeseia sp.]|nr:biosynthetic arginine decarboxylase [Woeseia sp.]
MVERIASINAPADRDEWAAQDAAELYRLDAWSDDFFVVNDAGRVAVRPRAGDALEIEIMDVVDEARRQGLGSPLLIRFQDVLRARVQRINAAFNDAIADVGYTNIYRGVYPIKVNQLHEVVEEVLDSGRPFRMGLECGSKAELIAALPHLAEDDMPLICNGVKDRSMLSLILAAQRLGKNVIPVMEKFAEFDELMRLAEDKDQPTQFGVRIRLRTSGSGKWADSGGYRSKFGVSLPELMEIVEQLQATGREAEFVLLHFHLGSQISDVQILRQATKEIAQIYAELVSRGIPVRFVDVGGGLGVDYSADNDAGAIHYSLQEYTNAVVSTLAEVCDQRDVPHPVLVSESGRAITAHHSVLVVETLGAYQKNNIAKDYEPPADVHDAVKRLVDMHQQLRAHSAAHDVSELLEAFHTLDTVHEEAATLFRLGFLPLDQDALIERLYWSNCSLILQHLRAADPDPLPAEVHELEEKLVDQYLCDFSVFQSVIDHWAIGQAFPIMPLERLDERPDRRAVLVDLTCDSDGKISEYVSSNDDKSFLQLHKLSPGKPYFLGFFLMGAYQDIMGDAHNLFGRVTELHVYADDTEDDNFWIEKVLPGIKVQDMLAQVQYFPNDLERRMNAIIKSKIDAGEIRPKQGMKILEQYLACFQHETYYDTRESDEVKSQ